MSTISSFNKMKNFEQFFVGYDEILDHITKHQDTLSKLSSYPPYNIRKTDDVTYVIEIAVAGFGKDEIDIEVKENLLTIKNSFKEPQQESTYLYRGIAKRDFTRTFALNDQVEVKGADLRDGLLEITLVRIIPDHKKPRKIQIASSKKSEPQLLI